MAFFGGKVRGLLGFLAIAALLLGGLGWATRAALRLEVEHRLAAENADRAKNLDHARHLEYDQLRLALWRLDARLTPALSREDSRPYPQYAALHTPFNAVNPKWDACTPGDVLLPSPLLTAEVPDWMRLHFQVDLERGWTSPQVIGEELQKALRRQPLELALNNVTPDRADLIGRLNAAYPAASIMTTFREMGVTAAESPEEAQRLAEYMDLVNSAKVIGRGNTTFNPDNNKGSAAQQQAQAVQNYTNPDRPSNPQLDRAVRGLNQNRARRDGLWAYIFDDNRANLPMQQAPGPFQSKAAPAYQTVEVQLGEMRPIWLPSADQPDHLVLVRGVKVGGKPVYQGFAIDWPKLQALLLDEVADLFPDARLVPLPPGEPKHPERAMTALPVEFDPLVEPLPAQPEPAAEADLPPAGWTPLRAGLVVAWVAVVVALAGVGLGGWTLIDLSERRIRFVSAVTHELRTPLTTLRLYLDLLSSGLVTEEAQKAEYLKTLDAEADRLHRLIGNVLDFARLEKSHPAVAARPTPVADLLGQLHRTWHERCAAAGKDLVVENGLPEAATVCTDPGLVEQIVSNLIDNAQKYSRDAADPTIVLRARELVGKLAIEVEDRGPGVTKRERCSIFRPFRRGRDADVKAGGVGLGLALATRWARYIGGTLSVGAGPGDVGACFRLEVPGLGK
ncbi:MAG TPA: HAMP domain-containing sensor histidine kinase [Gemmataceae bacterium]|nr:HAMP domain-containing sensor histidine kinase [Gemmataceae bacterium]